VNQDEFDFEAPDADVLPHVDHPDNRVAPSGGQWNEVPQALFLSWSPAMQRSYCAARDRDSAEHAENDWWRHFYLGRAETYVDSL
jgi:hypothetical protein